MAEMSIVMQFLLQGVGCRRVAGYVRYGVFIHNVNEYAADDMGNENDSDDEDDEEATVIKSSTGQRGTSQR